MSIAVTFYNFDKKENSTKRPTGGSSYNVVLKDGCSIERPAIELNTKPSSFYTYAYINDFSRYYFVSDWSYFRGVWTASLTIDVLASFKSQIGASSVYVLRSSNTYDKEIKDTMYPMKSDVHRAVQQGSVSGWAAGFSGGTYIAYVNSYATDNVSNYGSLGFMYFTPTQFSQLLSALYPQSNDSWNSVFLTQAYNVTAGALLNPIDYITKVIWVPKTLSAGSLMTAFGNYTALYGNQQIVQHGNLTNYRDTQTINISVPKRSDTVRGAWANTEPFGKYYLYWAPFGIIPLNGTSLIGAASIDCVVTLDMSTGNVKLSIYTVGDHGSHKDQLYSGLARVGVEVPIDKAKTDLTRWADGGMAIGAAVGDALMGNIGGAVNDTMTAIGSMNEASISSGGGTDGLLAVEDTIYLFYEYLDFVDEDNANKGRPLCQMKQISTIPGFIITNDGDVDIPGTQVEKSMVKSYLERGFYYE